jgi:hypothetical protein
MIGRTVKGKEDIKSVPGRYVPQDTPGVAVKRIRFSVAVFGTLTQKWP